MGGDHYAALKANGKILKWIVLFDGIHRYHFSYDVQRHDISPPKHHMLAALRVLAEGMRRRRMNSDGSPSVYAYDQETEESVGDALKTMIRIIASYSRISMRELAIALLSDEDPEGMARDHIARRGLMFLPRAELD